MVGGVGAGGGACPLKARATVRCTQYPLDQGWMSNSPAREENEAKAVVGIWDGQCRGPIVEEGGKKKWGGGEKTRLPNESKAVGLSSKSEDSSALGSPAGGRLCRRSGREKRGWVAVKPGELPEDAAGSERWNSRRERRVLPLYTRLTVIPVQEAT